MYVANRRFKPGDALIAAHEELEDATKTGLMQALAKAAQQVGGKEPLDTTNPTQLQALCLAAARIFGWKGESQVNVAVDARTVVVTEEKRRELQRQLKEIQDEEDNDEQSPAPNHPSRITKAATGQRRREK
jgi:hypothetical protein